MSSLAIKMTENTLDIVAGEVDNLDSHKCCVDQEISAFIEDGVERMQLWMLRQFSMCRHSSTKIHILQRNAFSST